MTVLCERFTELEGRRLRYLIGGQGKPLLLCHGFLSSAEEFGGRFSALAGWRTLIVPDLPGNSGSEPLPVRHTADALAAAVDHLLRQLDVDSFDLAGLCLGASVACALARRRGPAVGRLVLHTPLIAPGLVRARYRHQVSVLTRPPFWQAVVWLSRQRTVSDLYKRYIIQEGPVDRSTSDINFENQTRADPRAAVEWLRDALRRDDRSLVAQRSDPTLIIVAQNDKLVNVEGLQRYLAELPHAAIYVDPDGGHGWSQAAVQRHLEVLSDFFADH